MPGDGMDPLIGGTGPVNLNQTVKINPGKFREHVKVLKKLGEGAFGVVHECQIRSTKQIVAVKMIDLLEADRTEIENELRILCALQHPNVVTCHDIFREECFICILMDKYVGGDLVDGLQLHLGNKGKIPEQVLKGIVRQMLRSIAYLHDNSIIHRDVKGDNFLMTVADIADPQCRVALSDFGTAMKLEKGKYLKEMVGTRVFWSPEVCNRKYSFPSDVWAVGVITYGLLDGTFPFRDEKQIKEYTPHMPAVSAICIDLVKKFLQKDAKLRPSGYELLKHPWVADKEGEDERKQAEEAKKKHEEARKAMAAEALEAEKKKQLKTAEAMKQDVPQTLALRRMELMKRAEQQQQTKDGGPTEAKKFQLVDFVVDGLRAGEQIMFQWLKADQLQDAGYVGGGSKANANDSGLKMTVDFLEYQLKRGGVDTSKFGLGAAKTLKELCAEIVRGESLLMTDVTGENELLRVVDVVLLRIVFQDPNTKKRYILIETHEQFQDGRKRETYRLPGTKQRPHENPNATAERIIKTILRCEEAEVKFDFHNRELIQSKEESPSYPGVKTVYRKRIIPSLVTSEDLGVLISIGLPDIREFLTVGNKSDVKTWNWLAKEDIGKKNVVIAGDREESQFNSLVTANIKVDEDKLIERLQAHKINVSKFGEGDAASIGEFCQELNHGESALVEDPDSGDLVRVVDIVLLRIVEKKSKKILVEAGKTKNNGKTTVLKKRLPGTKRRPNDNIYTTARTLLTTLMNFSEEWFALGDHELVEEEKASASYPSLRTIYRKRIISVKMNASS